MDRTRKANRENDEKTLQYRTPNEAQQEAELIEEKLTELQAKIAQLEQTPEGIAKLERRVKLFGVCQRLADETSAQFCDKLRVWLERDLPQTKSPLHSPRQTGNRSTS
jgi:uncharacterized membrane protein